MRRPLLLLLACLLATGTATATPAVAAGQGPGLPSGTSGADGVSRHPFGEGRWTRTGETAHLRMGHTATLLPSGKVLVAGGLGENPLREDATGTAELYDPATGTWHRTGSMRAIRLGGTAILLGTGKVLVTGGVPSNDEFFSSLATAELYDPATRRWTVTGSMHVGRSGCQATLLPNGKVLVEGGAGSRSAELYDPATGLWALTGSMSTNRFDHTATALPDGRVLVAGGREFPRDSGVPGWHSSAEIYDPATGRWAVTQSMSVARESAAATALPDGRVLVAGGSNGDVFAMASTEIYDPVSRAWAAASPMHTGRDGPAMSLLANGTVLVTGGLGAGTDLSSAEVFDPAPGQWKVTGSMTTLHLGYSQTVLATGKVLVVGAVSWPSSRARPVSDAELYTPAP